MFRNVPCDGFMLHDEYGAYVMSESRVAFGPIRYNRPAALTTRRGPISLTFPCVTSTFVILRQS